MLFNVLEGAVRTALDEMIANGTYEGCTCDQCKNDVMALTLNRLKPRYSVSQTGEAHIQAELKTDHIMIDILRELNGAMQQVKHRQHHNR